MLKKEMIILYYGLKDKRTSPIVKGAAVLPIIYLLSPIDLIPDFIPFFGFIDDIVIVPLLLNLAIRLLPVEVQEDSLSKASANSKKVQRVFVTVIIVFISLLTGIFFLIRFFLINN
ncbi:MAG TPA: hypothetical protein DIC22_07185 [Chitinophagaceae bacterium]|nr:hypothetical protein [Chitinophagaceae bacterium]